jgi:hypothetical protein
MDTRPEIMKLEYGRLERLPFVPSQHDVRYLHTEDLKDPCVVAAGPVWHVFGSMGSSRVEEWQIFHATATHRDGPWEVQPPVILEGMEAVLGRAAAHHIAAPAVIYDPDDAQHPFHMVVQTEFMAPGGKIVHLASPDGQTFSDPRVILESVEGEASLERGIYDPHFAVLNGKKYLSYSGAQRIGPVGDRYMADPDIFLAESLTGEWRGPWERRGLILRHEDVPHHNQREHEGYEWGLEGSQLLELPSGQVLMVAVCFKPNEMQGLRQRIFLAVAREPQGPYKTLGIAIEPSTNHHWNTGENGHAMADMYTSEEGERFLRIWHQGRPRPGADFHWTHRYADFPLEHVLELARQVLFTP